MQAKDAAPERRRATRRRAWPPLNELRLGKPWPSVHAAFRLPHPLHDAVPTSTVLAHHPFIPTLNRPQVAEGRCGYAGSNKAFSVERYSVRKKELLKPLTLFELRLHPKV